MADPSIDIPKEDHMELGTRIDQIMSTLCDDDANKMVREILLAIKDGLTWYDDELVWKFNEAPNALGSKAKAWMPRDIQEYIGKIKKVTAVVVQPRMPSARRKAIYKSLDVFVEERGYCPLDLPLVEIYEISCACGVTFLGKEPEHQLKCSDCKISKKPAKINNREFVDQIHAMLLIVDSRDLSESIKIKVFSKIKERIPSWGVIDDEIVSLFEKRGFTREEFEDL